MFPKGFFASKEIKSVSDNSYIVVLEVIESSLSIILTDGDLCLVGEIQNDVLSSLTATVQCSIEKLFDYLSISVKESNLEYNDNLKKLTLKIAHGTKLTPFSTFLKLIDNPADRAKKIKYLLFLLVNKINSQTLPGGSQDQSAFKKGSGSSQPNFDHGYKIHVTQTSKFSQAKRSCPGMSIVNPTSKRVKSKSGVQFDDDGEDSDA